MNNNLCLKWNNHSASFLQSLRKVHIENCFCDATLVCQGIHFPVHRFVLSACSDYFEELFSKMQCQHPYVVFKDINSGEMELLLNYMYHGEVNVLQEKLPTLIQGAETLRLKGLAIPDDAPPPKESRKRRSCSSSSENLQSKGRSEERKRHRDSQSYPENGFNSVNKSTKPPSTVPVSTNSYAPLDSCIELDANSVKVKNEPLNSSEYHDEVIFSTMTADELNLQNTAQTVNFDAFPSESEPATEIEDPYPSPVKDTNSARVKHEPFDSLEYSEVNFNTTTADELNMSAQNATQTINFVGFPPETDSAPENGGTRLSRDRTHKEEDWEDVSEASGTGWSADISPEQGRLAENMVEMTRTNSQAVVTLQSNWNIPRKKKWNFSSSNRRRASVARHSTPLQCPFCDYKHLFLSGLNRHIRFRHTKEKPFACSFCGKCFAEKIARERHLRIHTGVKPFQCSKCFRKFSYKHNLKTHFARCRAPVLVE